MRMYSRVRTPRPPPPGGDGRSESQPVFNTAAVLDLLVRIPMLGLVNHLARRDRIRGERPRRGRDDQRHCKNRPEDTFDCMWLKCHDSPPGCAAGDLRGVIGRRCVSYVTLRWSSKKCKGACACGHHRRRIAPKSGPVHTGKPPPLGGRAARSESLACLQFLGAAGMCRVPGRRRMGVGFKIGLGGTYPPAFA